jgi:hypothetical protein
MAQGFSSDLISIYLWTVAGCVWFAGRRLPWQSALFIGFLRPTVSLLFFALWDDGRWLMLDDVSYFNHAAELLQAGFDPLSVIYTHEGFDYLRTLSSGDHVMYTWFNLTSQYLFGVHYYSAVFMNIALSFVAAHLFGSMLHEMKFPLSYCVFAEVFFLLHWDIIAWTSFINLKDMLVLALTLGAFYCCICVVQRRSMRHLYSLGGICFLFYWIRFYVPLLMLSAIGFWLVTQWKDRTKYLLAPLAVGGLYILSPLVSYHTEYMRAQDVVYGSFRFLFTPIPWNVEIGHSFLFIPSILHWLLAIPTAMGLWMLWARSVPARLPLLYFLVVLLLYGITEELQGPRHRFQLSFVIVWGQVQFLWAMRPVRAITQPQVPTARPLQQRLAA